MAGRFRELQPTVCVGTSAGLLPAAAGRWQDRNVDSNRLESSKVNKGMRKVSKPGVLVGSQEQVAEYPGAARIILCWTGRTSDEG